MMKSLSERLEEQQCQIDSRNSTIHELEQQVTIIKTELSNEKQALQLKVEANAKLQENNEKLN